MMGVRQNDADTTQRIQKLFSTKEKKLKGKNQHLPSVNTLLSWRLDSVANEKKIDV